MNRQQRGFTLIELIIVMIVTAIVVVMISTIISRPLTTYFDTQRRADLAERAQVAINRMTIELENPLPYSVRVTNGGKTLEFMPAIAAGRYWDGNGINKDNELFAKKPDDAFNHLGQFSTALTADINATATRIVVNNTSATTLYADATDTVTKDIGVITALDNGLVITPDCVIDGNKNDEDCADGGGANPETVDRLTLARGHTFDPSGSGSPQNRFYLVRDAVTYHCDLATETLMRYQGYTLAAIQPNTVASLIAGASQGTLASGVTDCQFVVDSGNGTYRAPLVTMTLTMESDGESVTLVKEVMQWNAP